MLRWAVILPSALFLAFAWTRGLAQSRSSSSPTQAGRTWEPGQVAENPEKRDGSIDNAAILAYLQQLVDRVVTAAGVQPVHVRVTQGAEEYASLLSNRVLYISCALLDRLEDEAELAGLTAHQLAHGRSADRSCVLASSVTSSWPSDQRGYELQATALAISTLKLAGYDPAATLDLLSKLVYEHPPWAKAINPDDLLDLRLRLESEAVPQTGYRVDSSGFLQFHTTLKAIPGRPPAKAVTAAQPSSRRR